MHIFGPFNVEDWKSDIKDYNNHRKNIEYQTVKPHVISHK